LQHIFISYEFTMKHNSLKILIFIYFWNWGWFESSSSCIQLFVFFTIHVNTSPFCCYFFNSFIKPIFIYFIMLRKYSMFTWHRGFGFGPRGPLPTRLNRHIWMSSPMRNMLFLIKKVSTWRKKRNQKVRTNFIANNSFESLKS